MNQVHPHQYPQYPQYYGERPESEPPPYANTSMPRPEIPKRRVSWFELMFAAFAVLTLLGLLIGLGRTAAAPQPVLDVPGEPATPQAAPTP